VALDHRGAERLSLHINDLEYLRAGWQKVVNHGQYGNTIYVFRYDGTKVMAVINKNQGVGELIETIVAATTANCPVVPSDAHGNNRSEPVNYDVQYEGTSKP
jgi:hypothetical protein